ncbi:group 1 glycosyl transferase [Pseudoalteromonas aurantia]|uniref:Group 1 glycosyl transferase n=1 Tax=Pseudoalteromonas aurantia TaxID=43654 RepID=A0A5S3VCR2_9GAMM|nr:group 1 glycosyl transferase [Pseudoalteromonas aurantia]TMO75951.1 group 1 glycosyl transferase [Pseudoalteromonas aurantia]
MNILLLSNMGASLRNPSQGVFVRRQFNALNRLKSSQEQLYLYEMPEKALFAKSSLTKYTAFFLGFFKRFFVHKAKLDVIHVHFFFPTILLAVIYKCLRNRRVKIIVTFHGSDIYHYSNPNKLYRYCVKFIDHAIFVSQDLKKRFYKSEIDSSIFSAGILSDFAVKKTAEKEFDFIFVGTLDENKGAKRLIELCEKLKDSYKFLVVGKGPYQAYFSESTHSNIAYIPHLDSTELASYYQKSLWGLSLSHKESFGLVISEAMACGTPVIATNTDGSRAQIDSMENGFLIAQSEELVKSIREVVHNTSDTDYQALSNKAAARAKKENVNIIAQNIFALYRKIAIYNES